MPAQWSTTQIVATVASAMALGAVCGVAFQAPAQTELYAPAATAVRTAIPTAPVTRMAAANQVVAEQAYEIPQAAQFAEFAEAEPVFVQAPAQGISWIGGAAAAVWGAAGAVMWQSRKAAQKVEADFYDSEARGMLAKGATGAAGAFAASPAMAVEMQTNSMAPIAVALFIVLPIWFLITLYVTTRATGNESGGYSQEYYDKSKARGVQGGGKLTNDAAVMKGKGTGMYAEK
mmetsp:Transcript_129924/g.224646  ORF Transcript_129924/g.224646 Transcript_129924/m.224646 type:complete len:232 (-) Transcript_129924:717-1412(-)